MAGGARGFPLTDLGRGRFATALVGSSRPVVNRVLFATVTAFDPSPFWLEIRDESFHDPDPGPAELGWVPRNRLVTTDDSERARPQNVSANLAMTIVSPSENVFTRELNDLLRLPPVVQEIVGRVRGGERARAVAIANFERVVDHFPNQPSEMRGMIEAILAAPLVPVFTSLRPTGRRFACDYVLRVEATSLPYWKDGFLTVEAAPPDSPLRTDMRFPLTEFPELQRVFAVPDTR